jgi:hypothetical protein
MTFGRLVVMVFPNGNDGEKSEKEVGKMED